MWTLVEVVKDSQRLAPKLLQCCLSSLQTSPQHVILEVHRAVFGLCDFDVLCELWDLIYTGPTNR